MATAAIRPAQAQRARLRSRRRPAALIVYFDTSALIKTILDEDGSEIAHELWTRAAVRVASRLVYPEARAALAAADRGARIDRAGARAAGKDLDAACATMLLIGLDWDLARNAGVLAERHALRGYDAVHLATALSVEDPDLVMLTWDRELAAAAGNAGRAVVPR